MDSSTHSTNSRRDGVPSWVFPRLGFVFPRLTHPLLTYNFYGSFELGVGCFQYLVVGSSKSGRTAPTVRPAVRVDEVIWTRGWCPVPVGFQWTLESGLPCVTRARNRCPWSGAFVGVPRRRYDGWVGVCPAPTPFRVRFLATAVSVFVGVALTQS